MQRREFLQLGTGALMAGVAVSRDGEAHAAQAPGTATGAATAAKLKVDAYSRHLQWLRTADEVAAATIEMGYDGVNLTVRDYPGHVNPANVAKELPPFVETLRARGLLVRSITTNIVDADSPHAEAILAAARPHAPDLVVGSTGLQTGTLVIVVTPSGSATGTGAWTGRPAR